MTNGKSSPNGWTLDTLEKHITTKITALEKYFTDLSEEREVRNGERFAAAKEAVATALASSEKATIKAETSSDKRAEASNEIRAAMIDQQKTFADRVQTDLRFGMMDQRYEENFKLLTKRIDAIDTNISSSSGRAVGLGMSTGFIVQVIASLAAIASTVAVVVMLTRG